MWVFSDRLLIFSKAFMDQKLETKLYFCTYLANVAVKL